MGLDCRADTTAYTEEKFRSSRHSCQGPRGRPMLWDPLSAPGSPARQSSLTSATRIHFSKSRAL